MGFVADLLSKAAVAASTSLFTIWFVFDEPECPEELI